ncbi:MAG TPA: Nif3-like dinuclear metal center hexameric protein [Thiolapillus brandeum]|uniref:Nif3-like dinuclear metal center hexameric protein n=1 Tax=Thiolapillus brandeum TaxID=1076588 RepID=A0A831NXQ5_9GAMM|nr:Nif3-like dinuclear metal center hexameric protein [Thiolapillus brandeum]
MTTLTEIIDYCDRRLDISRFDDYCPNGLQLEAAEEITSIVTGVTASLALVEAAAAAGADLLLVHHGYFWKNEAAPLTGMKGRRIQALYASNMSLAAYHLPLDVHFELGNNARLGALLGCTDPRPLAEEGLLWGAELASALDLGALLTRILAFTGREPLLLPGGKHQVRRLAWCTGGAQSLLEKAADLGFDAFITGEVSEACFHIAAERGIHFIAAGHHATERYGIQALGAELEGKFNIKHEFIDIPSPV